MTVGRITFGPAEPYLAPDLRRRGSVRGFDPAALAPTPSPEINPPRDIAPVQEWRIVPQTVNGIMPPIYFGRADFEGLPEEWPADTAWKTPMESK